MGLHFRVRAADAHPWRMRSETVIILLVLCGIVGSVIGNGKGKPVVGLVLGLGLGLLGVLLAALMSKTPQKHEQELAAMRRALGIADPPKAAWWPDPMGRHQQRYWDGTKWTEHVTDNGRQSRDDIGR